MLMNNVTFNQRIFPEKSFTIAYAFLLHNKSGSHYKSIRKFFLLLPEKKHFLMSIKNRNPSRLFFNSEASSTHCNILKIISQIIFTKNQIN